MVKKGVANACGNGEVKGGNKIISRNTEHEYQESLVAKGIFVMKVLLYTVGSNYCYHIMHVLAKQPAKRTSS